VGIILGIMSTFGNNKKHNDKFLKEIWNRIMMNFLAQAYSSLKVCHALFLIK